MDYFIKLFFFNYDQLELVRQWLYEKHGAIHPVQSEDFKTWNPYRENRSLCHWFMDEDNKCYWGQEYREEDIEASMQEYKNDYPNAEVFRIDLDPGIIDKNWTPPPPPPPPTIEDVFKF